MGWQGHSLFLGASGDSKLQPVADFLCVCVCSRQFKIPGCISAYDRVTEKQVKEAKLEPADS